MTLKLRDLIRTVRECKTAAEERTIIAKECAEIRASFSATDSTTRHRNISKLLYIHMLGYPTAFGQMECVKLITSPLYSDKRVGYLGLMLLLDENQEVVTLVTNSLQNDMKHAYQYVVGLALCALGNIGSEGIARDLYADVERLMESPSSYIRKKAALAAVHVVRKCPDLGENLAAKLKTLYRAEKNHGVMLALSALVLEICRVRPALVKELSTLVPFCCRVLKALVGAGYVAEYDVCGVCDPFLQVKLLRMLRVLGGELLAKKDARAAAHITGILAQVATNTESSRNVGNAVLYECVQTIFGLPVEPGLRVLAVNVLGRFLAHRDNNIRYVALNTLQALVEESEEGARALQRHKQTVVECLRDTDSTIRRRALDLVYALVDEKNVRPMTRDLLGYLVVADKQARPGIAAKLCWLIERFAPTRRWRFDMTVRVLTASGAEVPQEVPASLCKLVAQSTDDIHAYAAQRLYALLVDDHSLLSLVLVGLWCFGEYGDLMAGPLPAQADETAEPHATASPEQLLDLVDVLLRDYAHAPVVLQRALACLAKLSVRFEASGGPAVQQRIRSTLRRYGASIYADVQQRSCEFERLFDHTAVRDEVLERMPPPAEDKQFDESPSPAPPAAAPAAAATSQAAAPVPATRPASEGSNILDTLFHLPAGTSAPATPATSASAPAASPASDVLADLFGSAAATPQSPQTPQTPQAGAGTAVELPMYNKNGLVAVLQVARAGGNSHAYRATARLTASGAVDDVLLRVAVPKWLKLELEPASGSTLSATSPAITQVIKVTNTSAGASPVLLRVRVSYRPAGGQPVDDLVELAVPATF